jgi:hypothetical protein
VISKARSRYARETFEKFFEQALGLCVEAGLVTEERVFADSTLIRANASLNSVVPRSDVLRPSLSPKECLAQIFTENPVASEGEPALASMDVATTVAGRRRAVDEAHLFSLCEEGQKENSSETLALPAPVQRGNQQRQSRLQ